MKHALPLTIDFKKSYGSYLYDKTSGEKYLDFFNMYSSLSLGYNHPIFDAEFRKKISEISYIKMANNVCDTEEYLEFLDLSEKYFFSKNIHLMCTGSLAVEGALKSALYYKKRKNPLVISVKNSFHGVDSWGFVTSRVGITEKRMEDFPENNWISLDLDEIIFFLENEDLHNLAAIIVEAIQSTNGDIYLDKEKLKRIRNLCKNNDVCFIFDEIQTGFGTTGNMWYFQEIDIMPDILIFGKKSQVSGIVLNDKYKGILNDNCKKLGATFDGDLIDIIRATYILKAFEKFDILENVKKYSKIIRTKLKDYFLNYRSIGYLIAFDFSSIRERDRFIQKCFDKRLLINKAGDKTVRMRPNLALTKEEVAMLIERVLSARQEL